ncbi:MAG: TetR/AcrR family transcriptional regulator [Candidatus Omnitrophica bacterium]|nr:TetR/AcrR family transcriptional regulator [Candidatus Omnitrophota bacterium]
MVNKEYSLRERKHAKTKIAIMNAFIKRLEKTRFDDISVRQICKDVDVSEGTFFNYFPEKIDIINYYMHLEFLKVVWKSRKDVPEGACVALIDAVLENLGKELLRYDNIIYQLIALMIVQRQRPKPLSISDLERQIYLPDCEGIENIKVMLPDDFFSECLKEAVRHGELSKDIRIDDLQVSLMTILSGTLLAAKFAANKDMVYHFRRQLQFLWKGLGTKRAAGGR